MCTSCEDFFPIFHIYELEVRMIHKQLAGCKQEMCTRANFFDTVKLFPVKLDPTYNEVSSVFLLLLRSLLISFILRRNTKIVIITDQQTSIYL